jgi:hypothetical protein
MAKPINPNPGPGAAARRKIGTQSAVRRLIADGAAAQVVAQQLFVNLMDHTGGDLRFEDLNETDQQLWLQAATNILDRETTRTVEFDGPVWWDISET